MNKHHPLDEVFRRKLRDMDAEAPMHLWEQISRKRDWKHRLLNQARQKKPLVGLFAALLVAGLSWGVWSFQQPALNNFPIPLLGPVAAQVNPENSSAPTAPLAVPDEKKAEELPSLFHTAAASALPVAGIVKNKNSEQARQLATEAVSAGPPFAGNSVAAGMPSVRPMREAVPPSLPTTLEQQPKKGLSIFDGIFTPDPKCANFGNGSWSIYLDALLSPDLTFRQLQPRNPEFEEYVNTREETESNMYAFSGALRLSLVSDKGLALRTGLNFSQINERFTYINGSEEVIETINNYDQDGNIISTDTIVKIGTRRKITQNHYRMLDIPFLLGYELTSRKIKVSVNGGAYLNLLFRQKGDFLSPNDLQPVRFDSGDPDAYPAFKQQAGLGWYGSVGFAYQAGPNLQLVIEPHLKVYPKSLTQDQYGVQQRYITTGLFIGVRQQL
ncbi:MAG: hypothetical protein H6560_01185 [Lewinellaceae bacterium]|nr:hypothetical protein [Lewinellaceae bacterium]